MAKRLLPRRLSLGLMGCVLVVGGMSVGCGGADPNDAIAAVNATNLQRLTNLYFSYQMAHDWRGPRDEETFKTFLKAFPPQKLTRIGIDPTAIDALFVSERDEQPFTVRYGVRGSAMGSSEPVVFETVGVDGLRRVGFLDMTNRDVDANEYDQLLSGKLSPAPPTRTLGQK